MFDVKYHIWALINKFYLIYTGKYIRRIRDSALSKYIDFILNIFNIFNIKANRHTIQNNIFIDWKRF